MYIEPNLKNRYILVFFHLFFTLTMFSQAYVVEDEIIDKEKGIPYLLNTAIDQDKDGYLWIGSTKYLSRYDGVEFVNYTTKYLDIDLQHTMNFVTGPDQFIWYYTLRSDKIHSIKLLDAKTGLKHQFTSIYQNAPFNTNEIVPPLYRNDKHEIFITIKNKGLYKYDGRIFSLMVEVKENTFPIYNFSQGKYNWFAYDKTVLKVNIETNHTDLFTSPKSICYLSSFNDEPLFISIDNKLRKYSITQLQNGTFVESFPDFNLPNRKIVHVLNNIFYKDNIGNAWVLTENSFVYIDRNKKILNSIALQNSVNYGPFMSFIDNANNLWTAGNYGLRKTSVYKSLFENHLDGVMLRSLFKRDKNLFVSTRGALKIVDLENQKISTSPIQANRPVGNLYYNDTLWLTNNLISVKRYTYKNDKLTTYFTKDSSRHGLNAITRHPKTKKIFIGSANGLYLIDTLSNTIIKSNAFNAFAIDQTINIRSFKEEGDSLWICTTSGLFLMNENEKIVDWINKEDGLPYETTVAILIENKNSIWIATHGGGIINWDRANNSFTSYTEKDGLSNNNTYAIYKDKYSYLWIPTEKGLNKFAPKALVNKVFMPNNGIPNSEFNEYSHFQDKEGVLYFGGLGGLTIVNPDNFLEEASSSHKPNLMITKIHRLKKGQTNFSEAKDEPVINNTISITENEEHLEVSFSVLDFENEKPLQYQYKIEPIHKDYVLTEKNSIVLSNLSKGNYKLYIKGQSSDGSWSSLEKPVEVSIKRAIHKTTLILTVLMLLSVTVLFYVLKHYWRSKADKEKNSSTKIQQKTESMQSSENEVTKDKWLYKLDDKIVKNLSSINFSIEFLAQELELSERQLQRRIKKLTGMTPNKYITEIRLQEAYRLIQSEEINSVKQLSKRIGFSTTDYFSRLFKNRFGVNPSDFINKP